MTALRMAFNELRRITSGTLPKLAVVALALVPLLYAALYLYANKDPYQNLDQVPAALVVEDKGATASDGTAKHAGEDVATELISGKRFDWQRVDAAKAEEGVRNGTYTFALTLPEDFSQALLSSGDFTPRQGVIMLTTNDANNYLGSTIANQVVAEVRRSVSVKVGAEAADKLLLGFSTIRQKTVEAADGATKLATGQQEALTGSQQLVDGATPLADGAAQLADGLRQLRDRTKDLPVKSQQLADGAKQVSDGNETVARTAEDYAAKAQTLAGRLDQFNGDVANHLRAAGFTEEQVQRVMRALTDARAPVDDANAKVQGTAGQLRALATGAKQVSDGAAQLAASTPALTDAIIQLTDGATQVATGNAQLRDGATTLRDGEQQLVDGANQLRDGLNAGVAQIPNPDDPTRESTANTIGDPVNVHGVSQTSAGSYGAGLAPFFLGLATWIGAFVLFLLLKPLSRRGLAAGQNALRVALGGWLPGVLLGAAQVVIMFSVVALVVDIRPTHPLGTLGFLLLTSAAFVAVLHALNAMFGAVGKFIGLVLLILQLVSAGGTFPWQTIPVPLYPLHYGLPMGYAVDGLRHLMYGGPLGSVGKDALILLAYLVGSLALATFAAYKQRVWTPSRLKPELVL
ncbi:putative membrane protein [Saccharothrix tamanrassetensis]|uniref:Putative membrane protein n=1 Tax=Saccharothrix tamanrassetensis TaxID=1051531 RepID=A0A841CIX4_9PSEU|nr:YhgE/Pip domain-containing protein [Saccharothrix tamanrassetensis]MBB5955955.1 putative membrane protein [Saccharothrix tamanrassetensis]